MTEKNSCFIAKTGGYRLQGRKPKDCPPEHQRSLYGRKQYDARGAEAFCCFGAACAAGRDGRYRAKHVAETLAKKSEMGLRITRAYKAGDRSDLRRLAQEELPELKKRMETLRVCHMENWFKLYKSLGWDIMDMRYGSLLARIDSAITEITLYLDGKMERLEELEEVRLDYEGKPGMLRLSGSSTLLSR